MTVTFCLKRMDDVSFKVPYHQHLDYELVYYYSGNGYAKIDKDRYQYSAGYFTVIPPTRRHNDVHTTDCELIYIGFSLDENVTLNAGAYKDRNGLIGVYCNLLHSEFQNKRENYLEMLENILKNLVLEIKRHQLQIKTAQQTMSDKLQPVINYINEYYMTEITVEQLASTINYSYHHFRHIFKELLGVSPTQYIIQKRIEHAERLLTESNEPITKIAYMCGFPTASLFIEQFKSFNTLTPLAYRRNHKNKK